MKFRLNDLKKSLHATLLTALILGSSTLPSFAQTLPEPRREQLLNGLQVLLWNRPGDQNVYLKLRVHSGSAFDLAGRSGLMALLGDSLFPDPTTREYFTEELGGQLDVTSDYDTLNVTLSGKASEFERIVEILRTAVVTSQLTPENVAALRDARIKMVRELGVSPAALADRAIARRFFGDYPYGRPATGSPETLARVERPDLMQARDRFLNPNNSTLVILGGVDEKRAIRALKQLLGGWRRSDTIVPATFRQPDAPDPRTLIVDLPGTDAAEVRLAVRGVSRSDKDWAATTLLSIMARELWLGAQPGLGKSPFFVRHEARVLPGIFVMGATVPAAEAPQTLAKAKEVLQKLYKDGATQALLDRARGEAVAEMGKQADRTETLANLWLDAETYKLGSADEGMKQLRAVTLDDIRRTAARLFNVKSVASLAVGSAERLKPALEQAGAVEILGAAAAAPVPGPAPGPVKKQ